MKRLIHFFSLAVMTQVILMLSQLILLPIQVRLWGQAETALWYSELALATMTYFVDCGLRTAGHAELIKAAADPSAHPAELLRYRQIWSWIRLLILLVTLFLIAADLVAGWLFGTGGPAAWHSLLILACAVETVLIIRITYLDSLGRYRGAEASYFAFAVLRLSLSLPALLLFHSRAPGLAAIYLFTAVVALLAQGHFLCRTTPLLRLSDPFAPLSWSTLALARHTVAEPIANWARLSFPVLVIRQISSPMAVTTYVALRAVFGAGRTTVQQLARVASVEVLKSRQQGQPRRAGILLTLFVGLAIFFGSCIAFFVVTDNLRILGLWLKHFDRPLFQQIALAFALTAPFFSYQIPMNLMFRTGELAWIARRHYGFIACSTLFGGLSLFVKSLPFYLALLVVAEVLLSLAFFAPSRESHVGKPAIGFAAAAAIVIYSLWQTAHHNLGGWFVDRHFDSIALSTLVFVSASLTMACLFYFSQGSDIRFLRTQALVE